MPAADRDPSMEVVVVRVNGPIVQAQDWQNSNDAVAAASLSLSPASSPFSEVISTPCPSALGEVLAYCSAAVGPQICPTNLVSHVQRPPRSLVRKAYRQI